MSEPKERVDEVSRLQARVAELETKVLDQNIALYAGTHETLALLERAQWAELRLKEAMTAGLAECGALRARVTELESALSTVVAQCMRPESDEDRCAVSECRVCRGVDTQHVGDCPWLVALKALEMDGG